MTNGSGPHGGSLQVEYVRMYYEHQSERMGRLEDQRLTMSNLVITISVLAFSFGFGKLSELTVINGIGLPALMVFANLFAIAYIRRASLWMNVHRTRAKLVLDKFAPELLEATKSQPWVKKGALGSRAVIQQWLHVLLMATASVPILAYLDVMH